MWKTMDEATLKSKKVAELKEIAKTFGLKGYEKMRKAELVAALMKDDEPAATKAAEPVQPKAEEPAKAKAKKPTKAKAKEKAQPKKEFQQKKEFNLNSAFWRDEGGNGIMIPTGDCIYVINGWGEKTYVCTVHDYEKGKVAIINKKVRVMNIAGCKTPIR